MDTDKLIRSLSLITPLSAELQKAFSNYISEDSYPKKHLLLKEGQVAKRIYFIKEGFARAFYFTKNAKECTSWFMGQGDLMISVYSFFTQQPAVENIELLEDSVIQSMTWQQLQAIYADFKDFNYVGRILTEKYYIQSEERAILLRTLTAKERYERLLNSHPNIFQKAALGQIASYLGISQETLSRVRGKQKVF